MAILKNLVVNGSSRFLNKTYFQDVQIGGGATLSSLSLSGNFTVNGTATFNNTVYLTRTQDLSGTADQKPALIIGPTTDYHLEFDPNEIHAKKNATTVSDLYLNNQGGKVYLSGDSVYASGSTFVANTGNIVTLNSTNVNVTNNLRANHYDLQTVAQLGGSFYVSPTVKFPNSGTTLKVEKSGSTLTLTITDSSITSATMAGVIWTAGSGVKVSGTINGVVTGTMDGTVSSINTSSHVLILSVSGENSGNVQASPSGSPYNASQFKDLSVMLYTRKQNGTNKMINTASGAIASFTDGGNNVPVKQLVVDIEPVQDLHGQANPWPAGGGKNLIPLTESAIKSVSGKTWTGDSVVENGVTFTIQKDNGGNVIGISANGTPSSGIAQITIARVNITEGRYTFSGITGGGSNSFYVRYVVRDSSGQAISIDGSVFVDVYTVETTKTIPSNASYINAYLGVGVAVSNKVFTPMIRLSSVSDATFAPYSNICPISGHTSAVVTRTGKNLLKMRITKATVNGITIEPDGNGYVNISGTTGSSSYTYDLVDMPNAELAALFAMGGEYTLSLNKGTYNSTTLNLSVTYKETENGSTKYLLPNEHKTVPVGSIFLRASVWIPANTTPQQLTGFAIQLERNDTVTEFAPYQCQTVTIDLDGTRYGGTLDVGTGIMKVTNNYINKSSFGTLSSSLSSGGLHWVDTNESINNINMNSFCSMLDRKDGDMGWASTSPCYAINKNGKARVYCTESTKSDFDSTYTNLQIVCGLIEPFTIQLTPQEVRTLQGTNNVWSNTGDTNLIYESSQYDTTSNYNVGIWMNCYDQANSSSTIRVYNGSSRWPNVFLGNMTNADLPRVNGNEPYGYGLYSDNVFLCGIISATGGLIGNWTIGTTGMYYNSDAPGSTSITMIPGGTTASSTSIGGSSGSKQWVFTVKNLFGVDTSGALYSSSGKIGGWAIGTSSLYNTTNSMTSTGVGLYLGTDGIRNYSSGTQYVNITSGKITALGVDVSGKITATSGAIGGFDITSTAIKTKDVAVTSNADNSISLSSADFTRTINSTSRAGLRFAIGDKFGVTGDGIIYASSVDLTGKITATSGTIGGVTANSSYGLYTNSKTSATSTNTGFLISKDGAIYLGAYNSTNGACPFQVTSAGVLTATGATINGTLTAGANSQIGPWHVTSTSIYKEENTLGSETSGAAYFGNFGLSVGNKFKVDANGVATLGESSGYHATMDTNSFDVLNNDTTLATFGETVILGNENESQFVISSNSIRGVVGNSIDAFRFSISDAEMSSTRHWSKEVSDKDGSRNIQINITGLSTGAKLHFQLNATKNQKRDGTIISYDFTYGTSVDNVPFSMDNGISLQLHYNGTDLISYNIVFNQNDERVHSLFITFTSYTYGPYFSLGTRDEDGSFGGYSCTIGYNNIAYGAYSCAMGVGTIASKSRQLAIGSYNIEDTDQSNHLRFIIGNGSSNLDRSNAFTVDWHGNVVASGSFAGVGATLTGALTGTSATFSGNATANKFIGTQKVLWSGAWYMGDNQTAPLSENVADQANGIVLVWSYYNPSTNTTGDWGWNSHFIPKKQVSDHPGGGSTFILASSKFEFIATKYLYINNGQISGYVDNTATGTKNGITYANNRYVLRYVIGV